MADMSLVFAGRTLRDTTPGATSTTRNHHCQVRLKATKQELHAIIKHFCSPLSLHMSHTKMPHFAQKYIPYYPYYNARGGSNAMLLQINLWINPAYSFLSKTTRVMINSHQTFIPPPPLPPPFFPLLPPPSTSTHGQHRMES